MAGGMKQSPSHSSILPVTLSCNEAAEEWDNVLASIALSHRPGGFDLSESSACAVSHSVNRIDGGERGYWRSG